ncbi:hypothetical protein ZYGR_0U03170 [Zygosaccharomyces rouxii]|uniref:ZYRO0F15906p n=2 Tax=Zygosaccharomyces rouxii TaxID=4956 RepID=C5DYU8_ZYGRC|nr:uncharacterized protein ZYRO0F15906g [Zygosaccharomyces rouxii]GAV50461.1 hypothetical protein ZYGR_0U03170 [Zygosaccharomyces rouxii]CAQ43412.1 Pre-mRNA-splicing factor CWC25 [Zygosaccharomyces rouxii]CAR28959.1 ZYRO0F15906p [Zygosaccharomyces rouxii]
MGSSRDLNSLKSWNPKLSKNKASVKQLEQQLIDREKQLEKEAKRREVEDLASLKTDTLSWMYDTPKQEPQKPKQTTKPSTDKVKKPTQTTKTKRKFDYSKDDPMAKLKR